MINSWCAAPNSDGLKLLWSGVPSGGVVDHFAIKGSQTLPVNWASPTVALAAAGDSFTILTGLGTSQRWYFKVFAVDNLGAYFDLSNTAVGLTSASDVPGIWPIWPPSDVTESDGIFIFELASTTTDAAQTFRVQVSRDDAFTRIVLNEVVGPYTGPATVTYSNTDDPLNAGVYYWRARREAPSVGSWTAAWTVVSTRASQVISTKAAISDPATILSEGTLQLDAALLICRSGQRDKRMPFFIQVYEMGTPGTGDGDQLAAVLVPASAPTGLPWPEPIINQLDVTDVFIDLSTINQFLKLVATTIPSPPGWFYDQLLLIQPYYMYRLRIFSSTYSAYVDIVNDKIYRYHHSEMPSAVVLDSEDVIFTTYTGDFLETGAYSA